MYLTPNKAIIELEKNGVVALPTETVYGLAALANSQEAVQKIYKIKDRPLDNPLICHFYSYDQIKEHIPNISSASEILINHFCPGPISFLFDLPNNSSLKPATARTNNIVCRIPNHPITLKILKKIGTPLAAPSANTSSKFSPTSAEMVKQDLGDKIDGIVDGGQAEIGLESTIIDCRNPEKIIILRPGSIGKQEMEDRLSLFDLNTIIVDYNAQIVNEATIPGQKYKHYSPVTPIFEIDDYQKIVETENIAILGTQSKLGQIELMMKDISGIKFLNLGQNIQEIAHNLYQKLFELDQLGVQKAYLINLELEHSSLEQALNDKLGKIVQK